MPEYQKTITPSDTSTLRQKLSNWAALTDITVLETLVQESTVRVKGKKLYRGKGKFRIGLLILWIFIGFFVGIALVSAKAVGLGLLSWLVVPLGYVAYHFVRNRTRLVEFEVLSVGSQGSTALRISASDDFDDVKADVNSLVTSIM